jgi:hypothetical protein
MSPDEFADGLGTILQLETDKVSALQENARRAAIERFSVARFEEGWGSAWIELCKRRSAAVAAAGDGRPKKQKNTDVSK